MFIQSVTDGMILSELESESDSEMPSLTPRRQRKFKSIGSRRQSSRRSKTRINYKGMFALSGKHTSINNETTYNMFELDCAHLNSLDLYRNDFKSTLATRSLKKHTYISVDNTYEDMHHLTLLLRYKHMMLIIQHILTFLGVRMQKVNYGR